MGRRVAEGRGLLSAGSSGCTTAGLGPLSQKMKRERGKFKLKEGAPQRENELREWKEGERK